MKRIRPAPKPLHFKYPEVHELIGMITKEHMKTMTMGFVLEIG